MKNYGFDYKREISEHAETDYLVGAITKKPLFEVPDGVQDIYLPAGELQNIGEEKMDCVARAFHNKLEATFTYGFINGLFSKENTQWLIDNGYVTGDGVIEFSDAFTAILSGTTRQGNSLKAPAQSIHENGLIPKHILPQLSTFDEHHNRERITGWMRDLGLEFAKRFPINYARAEESQFESLCKEGGVVVGGYAWPQPVNGVYPKTDLPPNHSFWLYKPPKYHAFDNYLDHDGDYIKRLASDYDFMDIGYQIFISSEQLPEIIEKAHPNWVIDLVQRIGMAIYKLFFTPLWRK